MINVPGTLVVNSEDITHIMFLIAIPKYHRLVIERGDGGRRRENERDKSEEQKK